MSIQLLLEQAQAATGSVRALADGKRQELLRHLADRIVAHTDAIIVENKKTWTACRIPTPKRTGCCWMRAVLPHWRLV
ncbi:hypothetical protein MKQ70_00425 [Chitinophaga sedimenti]|uniref:hypothetical protein n=1 Tax=Chitinophaga sedimenti TaxID=2033606 RepID=UPI0020038980|nr:hypothetical protein [Chitinophaga sedimenti]MCK7553552.1 hypothetical protein [Chitinophaga sedimenti]